MAFSMNCTAIAASSSPMMRVLILMAIGFSHFAPRAASRKMPHLAMRVRSARESVGVIAMNAGTDASGS